MATALQLMVADATVSVGQLVDCANDVPACGVAALATMIGLALLRTSLRRPNSKATVTRRRQLILFGALITRMAFEVEGIPPDRSTRI